MKTSLATAWPQLAPSTEHSPTSPDSGVIRHSLGEAYYDIQRKEYLVKDGRDIWIPLTESQFKRHCKLCGIGTSVMEGRNHSRFDEVIYDLQHSRGVDFAGPIAGYMPGIHLENDQKLLVTRGPNLIEPREGRWDTLRTVFEAVLEDPTEHQLSFWHGWLHVAVDALRKGLKKPGQALVLVGPAECGKSLLQDLITTLLGGREAKPYKYMTEATHFNGNLIGAEHLRIGDENPHTDIRARRNFGSQIKNITVETAQNIEAKYRDAMTLRPFWRLSISLNDEPENLLVLPPLDDHLMDKMIILKAFRREMPMPTITPEERREFWRTLEAELPAYLYWLLSWKIPENLRAQRFGIRHFTHPELRLELEKFEPHSELLALMDAHLFEVGSSPVRLTAEEIQRRLTDDSCRDRFEARKLLSFRGACGRYLAQLANRNPDRVVNARSQDRRLWEIRPPYDA